MIIGFTFYTNSRFEKVTRQGDPPYLDFMIIIYLKSKRFRSLDYFAPKSVYIKYKYNKFYWRKGYCTLQ